MEEILRSILETEKEAEKILAEAKVSAGKISQDAGEEVERLKVRTGKAISEKVEAVLSKVRQEAAGAKEKIMAEAEVQAQSLEKQAQARIAQAVEVALNRLLVISS